ncbi:hypothetical protein I3760_06G098100 [Carya illinoinensis]|nr:hypothetical protein I3760_06G098100 [Carya illinoinensis]
MLPFDCRFWKRVPRLRRRCMSDNKHVNKSKRERGEDEQKSRDGAESLVQSR